MGSGDRGVRLWCQRVKVQVLGNGKETMLALVVGLAWVARLGEWEGWAAPPHLAPPAPAAPRRPGSPDI